MRSPTRSDHRASLRRRPSRHLGGNCGCGDDRGSGGNVGCGDDRGQATVELALALPLLMLFLLAGVQLAVVIRDQLAVISAAREAARAAAVSTDPAGDGSAAGLGAVRLPGMSVSISGNGTSVTARITHTTHTDVPLVGLLLPDIEETATATMRVEP